MKSINLITFVLFVLFLSSCGHTSRNKFDESNAIDSCVVYKPLSEHITKCHNRKPKYIVIHYTAGSSSKSGEAESLYDVYISKKASTDFAVDDENIVQFNPDIDNYYCWAVGDSKKKSSSGASLHKKATNKNTINIEICSNLKFGAPADIPNHSGWFFSEASLDNAVRITKIIMKKYNIPTENIIRHYDVTGKVCPGVIGWNNEVIYNKRKQTKEKSNSNKWKEFKKRLVDGSIR